MISIETKTLPGTVSKGMHVRARAHGVSTIYIQQKLGDTAPETHKLAAQRIATLAFPRCTPEDLVLKLVHHDYQIGFAVWIAFDRVRPREEASNV